MLSAEPAEQQASASWIEERDAAGNLLADGYRMALTKDSGVMGAGRSLQRGIPIKSIRLTEDPEEIDFCYEAIKRLVLRAELVRKRG